MPVTSQPMRPSSLEAIDYIRQTTPWRAIGALALAVGVPIWLIGARYTILGAPRVIAFLFGLFRIDMLIDLPIGWPLLYLTIATGAIISLTEFGCRPRRSFFDRSIMLGSVLFLIWLGANAADLSSTFIGITTVQPDSWPIAVWAAATAWVSILETCFLTYFPELCIIAGMRWLIRGRF